MGSRTMSTLTLLHTVSGSQCLYADRYLLMTKEQTTEGRTSPRSIRSLTTPNQSDCAKCSIRTKRAGSGCTTCTTRVCSRGATACTTASSGETGIRPPIRELRSPLALQEQPLERPRLRDVNNIEVRVFLCANVENDVEVDCACHCDVCEIYGDLRRPRAPLPVTLRVFHSLRRRPRCPLRWWASTSRA